MQAIVEAFTTVQEDLSAEKKVMMKQWAKREMQIERGGWEYGGALRGFAGDCGREAGAGGGAGSREPCDAGANRQVRSGGRRSDIVGL
jgi:hypothetical protein